MDEATADRGARVERPWWVPLVGLGSICLGGVQALGGLLLLVAAASAPPEAGGTFAGAGLAWLVPGGLLGVSGLGVLIDKPWGRKATLLACGVWLVAVGFVAVRRAAIPPAIADWVDHLAADPDLRDSELGERLDRMIRDDSPIELLRDPDHAPTFGWVYTGYCACPSLPWMLLVALLASTPPGRFLGVAPDDAT